MATQCNCSDEHCNGDKSTHKHENGEYIHTDGIRHPTHEQH